MPLKKHVIGAERCWILVSFVRSLVQIRRPEEFAFTASKVTRCLRTKTASLSTQTICFLWKERSADETVEVWRAAQGCVCPSLIVRFLFQYEGVCMCIESLWFSCSGDLYPLSLASSSSVCMAFSSNRLMMWVCEALVCKAAVQFSPVHYKKQQHSINRTVQFGTNLPGG